MSELSTATQAVLDAFTEDNSLHDWKHNHYNTDALAAALRAAADQVVPAPHLPYDSCCDVHASAIRAELLALAAELETQ